MLAQRLLRTVCRACRAPYDPPPEELAALRLPPGSPAPQLMKAVGCDECQGIGYKGRAGLFELLVLSDKIRPMIIARADVAEIRAQARAEGMRTLREDGIAKVLAGETTVEEMLRETQDDEA